MFSVISLLQAAMSSVLVELHHVKQDALQSDNMKDFIKVF